MADKILTLHPEGKKGVRIDKAKYLQVKEAILSVLENGPVSYAFLNKQVVSMLKNNFDGKIPWYVVTVKLDLEARKIIERTSKTYPHMLKLINQ